MSGKDPNITFKVQKPIFSSKVSIRAGQKPTSGEYEEPHTLTLADLEIATPDSKQKENEFSEILKNYQEPLRQTIKIDNNPKNSKNELPPSNKTTKQNQEENTLKQPSQKFDEERREQKWYYNNSSFSLSSNHNFNSIDLGQIDFSNVNIIPASSEKTFGNLVAQYAKKFIGIKEVANNVVPELQKYLSGTGINVCDGQAWCAALSSAAFNMASKSYNIDLSIYSEGVLNLKNKFEDSFIDIKKLKKEGISEKDLIGSAIIFKRGDNGSGHTGIVTSFDTKTGDITVVEGNIGKSGKTLEMHYNLFELVNNSHGRINSDGTYKSEFLGFASINRYVEKHHSEAVTTEPNKEYKFASNLIPKNKQKLYENHVKS
jgi:hypothetical protein